MTPPSLQIALIQTDLYWKDKVANMAMLEEKISQLQKNLDLIVLPEMFPTGFTMDTKEVGEPMNFTVTKWMKQMASHTGAVIAGSVIITESGRHYNRMLWVFPDGQVNHYDKRHLFRMAGEDQHFSMGNEKVVIALKGWKILPQVCYDLRFPVWSRNTASNGEMAYDVLVNVASWPSPRVSAWDILLKARAVENLCYAVGVNRIGVDGNEVSYSGHSAVYGFKGETIADLGEEEGIVVVALDYKQLANYREKFPAWEDADRFLLEGL
jgi:omega-amidase